MIALNDRSGEKYNFLTLIKISGRTPHGHLAYLCKCDCGNEKEIVGASIFNGRVKSCGCYSRMSARRRMLRHGHTFNTELSSPTYNSWANMRQRCENKNNQKYPIYGGRGITVCDRWNSFKNFLADMGEKPKGLTLDRIDPNKGYCPENCRWADKSTQAKNKQRIGARYAYDLLSEAVRQYLETQSPENLATLIEVEKRCRAGVR